MKASLLCFLRTGELDGLAPGVTKVQVIQRLGPPEATGGDSWKHREPSIYKYGDVELFFTVAEPRRCHTIYIESAAPETEFRLPSAYEVEDWELVPGVSRATAEAYLRAHGLEYQRTDGPSPGTSVIVTQPGKVKLSFDEDGRLWSFTANLD
jgi:hypothetical protein